MVGVVGSVQVWMGEDVMAWRLEGLDTLLGSLDEGLMACYS